MQPSPRSQKKLANLADSDVSPINKDKLSGSAPINNNKHSGSTFLIPLKVFWELYILSDLVPESSRITPGDLSGNTTISTLGVLPENLFMFCGSNISNLYILSILIPV